MELATTQSDGRKLMAKWGFGMAPISDRMRARYDSAVSETSLLVKGKLSVRDVDLERLSDLKGMFNRCVRQDQWDWFTVYSKLGRPPREQLRMLAQDLVDLRRACQANDRAAANAALGRSIKRGIIRILDAYVTEFVPSKSLGKAGWLYLLTTKDRPDVIKIGMTQRSVEERVKEINSATGVLVPYATRRVYPVKDAYLAEKKIHNRLDGFRIRLDREFFQIPFADAVTIVEECLAENALQQRPGGRLVWQDKRRGYGFLESPELGPIFLHLSEVNPNQAEALKEGSQVEFDLIVTGKGMAAQNASIANTFPT